MRLQQFRVATVSVLFVLGFASGGISISAGEPARHFGAPLRLTEPTPLADVLRAPEAHTDAPVLLRGRIADVCQHKGCWTVLQDGDAFVRVRFADYGFFVPTDSRGEHAWVEGRAEVRTLSQSEARHYAAESSTGSANQDPEKIFGPQREVEFVATGVRFDPRE